jgi:HEAT repeat protein
MGAPGGPTAAGAPSTGGFGDVDLTAWSFFWEFNKDPYLALKEHVHRDEPVTGDVTWFLGEGTRKQSVDRLKPSESEIRNTIVPALVAALQTESNNDVVTGCLIALAKIGDAGSEDGRSVSAELIRPFLSDRNQEISETAALALGILGHPASAKLLTALVEAGPSGRALVGDAQVSYRTRAFAAYALGLIGARSSDESVREEIVGVLARALLAEDGGRRDLAVASISAIGLVPLVRIGTPGVRVESGEPVSSRCGQLDLLLAFFGDEENDHVVRAHCPVAMVRLLVGLPPAERGSYGERIGQIFTERLEAKRVESEITQSAVLALGDLAASFDDDGQQRKAIVRAMHSAGDVQTRLFALVALARAGGAEGLEDPGAASEEVRKVLLTQLGGGNGNVRAWAALACGILAREQLQQQRLDGVAELQRAVRLSFEAESDPQQVGAHAIALGLMNDIEATPILLERFVRSSSDDARGYIALGLGLMNARSALDPIQAVLESSKYRPELLKQVAIALGLLGDKDVVPQLVQLLKTSRGLATQAALSTALGFIGDRRSIEPLIALLKNQEITGAARGLAAAALGVVADKEALPWNSKLAVGINYRASTETLTSTSGTGLLDIL